MGVFSVSPCSGILHSGGHQVVTVDRVAEQLGSWCQGLLIDITDRDPSDHPEGIPYRLLAEVCKPGGRCLNLFCHYMIDKPEHLWLFSKCLSALLVMCMDHYEWHEL